MSKPQKMTMRVAVYYNNRDIRLEDRPIPRIGAKELLMRVEASGICGSDVMEWYRVKRAPLVLGHEVAGEVVGVGEAIEGGFRVGQRITASHHVPCNACHYCLTGHQTMCETMHRTGFDPGGFAQFIRLQAINVERGVFPIPEDVSFEEASFTEPLGCVLRGQRLANLRPGDSVLVIGSGVVGILHIQLARATGAYRIFATDMNDFRLEAAMRFGADLAFKASEDVPSKLREANDGRLADKVILCTGAATAAIQALKSVERGGTVLFFATPEPDVSLPLPLNELFWRSEVSLTSSYAASPADLLLALKLIRSRRIRVREMITHRLSLEEIALGFQLVANPGRSLKVIIEPQR